MKFDYIIGNPPYQEETERTSDKPIYNYFMNSTYQISNKVVLITPARFLFNAGKTPKKWNKKMLNDEHFKVLEYFQNSSEIFSNTDIKGGIAIHYHDKENKFKKIGVFIPYKLLKNIFEKVQKFNPNSISNIVYAPESYKFTNKAHEDNPKLENLLSKGHKLDITTNIFDKTENIVFFSTKDSLKDPVKFYGLKNKKRNNYFIEREYINCPKNFEYYKVILPKSNGSGALGETLSQPFVSFPNEGHTQTFISIGKFKNELEAQNLLKYIKSKFARALLGTLKVTQDNKKNTWNNVPIQDFTENSDVDWTKSISEIDQQLYQKYGLNDEEIEFIETHIKEME